MLLARLQDGALIRCDCMIMKRRNAMSEQLTRHKRLRLVKFLISSKCHRAHLGSESEPSGRLVLQHRCQLQGCLPSLVAPRKSLSTWSPLLLLSPLDIIVTQAGCKVKRTGVGHLRGGIVAKQP